jgi:hypothetical protein
VACQEIQKKGFSRLVIILQWTGVGLVFKCHFSGVGNNDFRLKGHYYLVRF